MCQLKEIFSIDNKELSHFATMYSNHKKRDEIFHDLKYQDYVDFCEEYPELLTNYYLSVCAVGVALNRYHYDTMPQFAKICNFYYYMYFAFVKMLKENQEEVTSWVLQQVGELKLWEKI